MVYRAPHAAPVSAVPKERRGRVVGRFCTGCGSTYPLYAPCHRGKPMLGKDHVASPCSHEGDGFEHGASWWEDAVELLPAPVPVEEAPGQG